MCAMKGVIGARNADGASVEMENRTECTVAHLTQCPKCLSKNINYKCSYIPTQKNIQVQAVCLDCGCYQILPHEENLKKRANSTLSHWRAKVVKRDNGQCVICKTTENLEVHHIIPVSYDVESEYKYMEANGITLCHKHHLLAHGKE